MSSVGYCDGGGPRAACLACVSLAALILLALPSVGGQQSPATNDDCLRNLRHLALAAQFYAQDNDDRMPPMLEAGQVSRALYPYVKEQSTFRCPVTGAPYQPNPALNYVLVDRVRSLEQTVMFRDYVPHREHGSQPSWNAAYLDGHARTEHTEPVLGKPAPTPPPPDHVLSLRRQLAVLYGERKALNARIHALEGELRRLRKSSGSGPKRP